MKRERLFLTNKKNGQNAGSMLILSLQRLLNIKPRLGQLLCLPCYSQSVSEYIYDSPVYSVKIR